MNPVVHQINIESEEQFGGKLPAHDLGLFLSEFPAVVRSAVSMRQETGALNEGNGPRGSTGQAMFVSSISTEMVKPNCSLNHQNSEKRRRNCIDKGNSGQLDRMGMTPASICWVMFLPMSPHKMPTVNALTCRCCDDCSDSRMFSKGRFKKPRFQAGGCEPKIVLAFLLRFC